MCVLGGSALTNPRGDLQQITILAGPQFPYLIIIHSGLAHIPKYLVWTRHWARHRDYNGPCPRVLPAQPSTGLKDPSSPSLGRYQRRSVIGKTETQRKSAM